MIIAGWEIGTAVRHAAGHDRGGDRAIAREIDGTLVLAVIDVLGHGEQADRVACDIDAFFAQATTPDATTLMQGLNTAISGSIGAAAGIVTYSVERGEGVYTGVGNTVCKVLGSGSRTLVSADGVIGHRAPALRGVKVRLDEGETLLLHTDGISSRIDWRTYPEVVTAGVELAASEVVRKFGRSHDDVSCVVARPER